MIEFKVKSITKQPDGYGGFEDTLTDSYVGKGWLDMLTGSNQNTVQHASIEQSTHVLMTDYFQGYHHKIHDDAIVIVGEKQFTVTYVDNPVEMNHHLEIYLKFDKYVGDANG